MAKSLLPQKYLRYLVGIIGDRHIALVTRA